MMIVLKRVKKHRKLRLRLKVQKSEMKKNLQIGEKQHSNCRKHEIEC
jgi:hypothetical protein